MEKLPHRNIFRVSKILIALILLTIVACAIFDRGMDKEYLLPSVGDFISFSIELADKDLFQPDETGVKLIFYNFSDETILIYKPVPVFPVLFDSLGNKLSQKFRGRAIGDEAITLKPKEAYETIYYLQNLFEIKKGNTYMLKFAYYGKICNKKNEIIANGCGIYSNLITFVG